MSKKLLIIRSASMQQLDKNLVNIVEKFPNYQIDILTHEHNVQLIKKYNVVNEVIVYPYNESFNSKKTVKVSSYDAVIILVTNLSGVGFNNVLNFSLTIPSKKKFICNLVSEISEISEKEIRVMNVSKFLMTFISIFGTTMLMIPMVLLLPLKLLSLKKVKNIKL